MEENVEVVRRWIEALNRRDVAVMIELSASATWVYRVENGQITGPRLFQEEAEALEAVGLAE